ncbi:MAG: phosphoribosylformylglycinamidine synthase subunit PurQ [candidate division NC10 bacterium]|nr:phosphoribosylformylglycinamidine synthase subunit PurQ [candidate division NC10 bacterium]
MRVGVLVFPGTWSHQDFAHVLGDVVRSPWGFVWHKERSVAGYDCLILPGGFAHGDYLRCGAIARFSPVMEAVVRFAKEGGPVIGSCNGFQILCEAGLLPGALLRNTCLQYRCQWVHIRTENRNTPFTRRLAPGQLLRIPISHGEGRYYAAPETLAAMRARGQIVFRYATADGRVTAEANPNGSLENIAGVSNEAGNVVGLMPHPERAAEALLGSQDGLPLFLGAIQTVR